MKISLLSDTHGHLDTHLMPYLIASDQIWHAGDIGNVDLLQKLNNIKPLEAVYGNIDGQDVRSHCPEWKIIKIQKFKALMIHIAGVPGKYHPGVQKLINEHRPHALICGHSHIVRVQHFNHLNLLHINPGACGIHGFHKVKTLIQFEILETRLTNMNLIELGPRAKIT